ncbi:LuxR C-terminal-related transcriptional regulator [Litoreibacter sp.]|nr:LuxR C-terminal-related transcriptional regulator [Litoreibacter sp.]
MSSGKVILIILLVQATCAVLFVSDILFSIFGLRGQPLSWELRELMEIGAGLGLVLGGALGMYALHQTRARNAVVEDQLRLASGAFHELLEERFTQWGLTPAERDVALFAIKGVLTADIARLRETSEGTVKAQTNAIYRKAGVSGKSQLVSLFVEDLMADPLV